jgi:hypothetical protein
VQLTNSKMPPKDASVFETYQKVAEQQQQQAHHGDGGGSGGGGGAAPEGDAPGCDAASSAAAASQASEQLRAVALFDGYGEEDEDADGKGYDSNGPAYGGKRRGASPRRAWWRRRRVLIGIGVTLMAVAFVLIGVTLQMLKIEVGWPWAGHRERRAAEARAHLPRARSPAHRSLQAVSPAAPRAPPPLPRAPPSAPWTRAPPQGHAFRWLYFFAALPFLWWAVSFIVRRIYVRIELAYFQELVTGAGAGVGMGLGLGLAGAWLGAVWGGACVGQDGVGPETTEQLASACRRGASRHCTPPRTHPSPQIYYWTSLRFSTSLLASSLLALPVYQTFFVWCWCHDKAGDSVCSVQADAAFDKVGQGARRRAPKGRAS